MWLKRLSPKHNPWGLGAFRASGEKGLRCRGLRVIKGLGTKRVRVLGLGFRIRGLGVRMVWCLGILGSLWSSHEY